METRTMNVLHIPRVCHEEGIGGLMQRASIMLRTLAARGMRLWSVDFGASDRYPEGRPWQDVLVDHPNVRLLRWQLHPRLFTVQSRSVDMHGLVDWLDPYGKTARTDVDLILTEHPEGATIVRASYECEATDRSPRFVPFRAKWPVVAYLCWPVMSAVKQMPLDLDTVMAQEVLGVAHADRTIGVSPATRMDVDSAARRWLSNRVRADLLERVHVITIGKEYEDAVPQRADGLRVLWSGYLDHVPEYTLRTLNAYATRYGGVTGVEMAARADRARELYSAIVWHDRMDHDAYMDLCAQNNVWMGNSRWDSNCNRMVEGMFVGGLPLVLRTAITELLPDGWPLVFESADELLQRLVYLQQKIGAVYGGLFEGMRAKLRAEQIATVQAGKNHALLNRALHEAVDAYRFVGMEEIGEVLRQKVQPGTRLGTDAVFAAIAAATRAGLDVRRSAIQAGAVLAAWKLGFVRVGWEEWEYRP